ncbi:MAG: hypothetical protein LBL66_02390 [Clostridiales bacterium]|jgi:hypothetical protein|nr:hypothetical protein [Clostridiales bacterium]
MNSWIGSFGEGRSTKKDIKAFAQMIASLEFFLGKNHNGGCFADISDVGYKFKAEQKKGAHMPKSPLCLNEFAREVHGNAVERGLWEKEPPFPEIIAMCHGELSEALTEWRRAVGFPAAYYSCHAETRVNAYCRCKGGEIDPQCMNMLDMDEDDLYDGPCYYRGRMPRGIAIELADCILRIFDYCAHAGIDLEQALCDKLDYDIRPARKHGGKRK